MLSYYPPSFLRRVYQRNTSLSLRKMLALLVLILLDRAADGACPPDIDLLTVELPEVVLRHADPLQINCTVLFNKRLGRHCVFTEEHTSLFVARNLTRVDWDTQAHCSVKLNESLQYKNLTITVYKIPDNMSISTLNHTGPMMEGTEYHLQCDIQNVAPLQNLVVKWYKGNESLLNVTYSNSTKTPVDVSPTLTITPSRDDDGAQYRCEAELDLGPEGPEGPQPPPTVSSEYQIHVEVRPQHQPFPTTPGSRDTVQSTVKPNGRINLLELNPPSVVVKYGDPVSVDCSTSSTDIEGMGWEASFGGTDVELNVSTVTWIVDNLEEWTIEPVCYITTSNDQVIKKLPVILYKTPDSMAISPLNHSGPMMEGTEYHLQCDIQNVAPLQNLVVKWYKGNESLLNVTYSNSTKTPVDVSPTLTITPSRDDDGAQYRCEAELDLGPEGPQPPPTVSSEYQIHVEVRPQHRPSPFPTTPGSRDTVQSTVKPNGRINLLELNPPSVVVKYGDPVSVDCSTSSTDIEGMGWEASFGGTDVELNVSTVTWIVDNLEEWTIEPVCYITTSNDQVIKKLPVILYKTPDSMAISPLNHSGPMMEGTEYHLQCDIQNVAPLQNLVVKWYKGNESLLNVTYSNSTKTPVDVSPTLTISPSRDDDGAQYRCEAELDLGPEGPQPPPTVPTEPLKVTVHYKPEINCPLQYIGVEKNFTLDMSCVVMGNPPPDTVWNREGKQVSASTPLDRTESGLYTLSAFNDQGSTSATVQIIVEYAPEWTCPYEYEIKENESLLPCRANGHPKPEISLFKDQKPLELPRMWTRQNIGNYTLVSRNKHGEASHTVHIDVLYAPEILPENGTPVIVSAGSNVSLSCSAQGNPPPEVKWNYTDADNVNLINEGRQSTVRITRATSTNAGIYICTATNRVGMETRETTVTIATIGYSTILMAAFLTVFLVFLILLCYYCRWTKRRGDYNFHPINSNIHMMPLSQDSK